MSKKEELYKIANVLNEEPSLASFDKTKDGFELGNLLNDYLNEYFKLEEEINKIDFEEDEILESYDLDEYSEKEERYRELHKALKSVSEILNNLKNIDNFYK